MEDEVVADEAEVEGGKFCSIHIRSFFAKYKILNIL